MGKNSLKSKILLKINNIQTSIDEVIDYLETNEIEPKKHQITSKLKEISNINIQLKEDIIDVLVRK